MKDLNDEPAVISLANELDLDPTRPADSIKAYCHERVERFLGKAKHVKNIKVLQALICKRLSLVVHEIWSDSDLSDLAAEYLSKNEIAIAGLVSTQMKPNTFGMIVSCEARAGKDEAQYVTFIDCRGAKAARRVWTLWHEIAHCLTTREQLALPLRRTTTAESNAKDPVERLTDSIAADFAFYEPLFGPILKSEIKGGIRLTFGTVERVRDQYNPEASFDSTLRACVNSLSDPVIFLEAGLSYKAHERKLIECGKAESDQFKPSLRVLGSVANSAARQEFPHIPKQWRVPKNSVISKAFSGIFGRDGVGISGLENFDYWSTSCGNQLPNCVVNVEARTVGERVIALFTLG